MSGHHKQSTAFRDNGTLEQRTCPFVHTLAILGPRWRSAVLWKINAGNERFSELLREIPGLSAKMLAQTLAALIAAQCVERIGEDTGPSYRLSTRGQTLIPVLEAMQHWARTDVRLLAG
jgi:DNA-binding HxlR family transcriptional regulator